MTDYKQLCAELLSALENEGYAHWIRHPPDEDELCLRARAALAEPEPQRRCIYNPVQIAECGGPCEQGPEHCDCGELWVTEPEPKEPTSRQLMMLADDMEMASVSDAVEYARAVLARWGNHPGSPDSSTPQPVPVSERLPGPGDCDAEGRCWLCGKVEGDWRLINPSKSGVPQLKYCFSHWLPAHALPQPS